MHERFELVFMCMLICACVHWRRRQKNIDTDRENGKDKRQTDLKQHTYTHKVQSIDIDMRKDMKEIFSATTTKHTKTTTIDLNMEGT